MARYDQDFIIEVIEFVRDNPKQSVREIGSKYNVPYPTLAAWWHLYRADGRHEVVPEAFRRKNIRSSFDSEQMHEYLSKNPYSRITDIAKHFNVFPSQVCSFMKNHGYHRAWVRKTNNTDQ